MAGRRLKNACPVVKPSSVCRPARKIDEDFRIKMSKHGRRRIARAARLDDLALEVHRNTIAQLNDDAEIARDHQ